MKRKVGITLTCLNHVERKPTFAVLLELTNYKSSKAFVQLKS